MKFIFLSIFVSIVLGSSLWSCDQCLQYLDVVDHYHNPLSRPGLSCISFPSQEKDNCRAFVNTHSETISDIIPLKKTPEQHCQELGYCEYMDSYEPRVYGDCRSCQESQSKMLNLLNSEEMSRLLIHFEKMCHDYTREEMDWELCQYIVLDLPDLIRSRNWCQSMTKCE